MVSTTEFDELIEMLRDFIRREVMPAEAGIDAYETKPVAYQRLMRKIEGLVKSKLPAR